MIQITPQMRVLVAIERVDGRKGIDSLVRLCQEKLAEDPFPGVCSYFEAAAECRSGYSAMTYVQFSVMCSLFAHAEEWTVCGNRLHIN